MNLVLTCPVPAVGFALLTSCRSALSRSGCSFHSWVLGSLPWLFFALLFSCHSSLRSGSTFITVFWISSFFALSQASLPCFLRYHPMWPSLPSLPKLLTLVQLELCSLHGIAASLHVLHCASARSSTCCAWTWWSQHHTLPPSARCACRGCVSRGRLLWVVQSTTTLLVSSYRPPLQGRNLLSVSGLVSLLVSSTLW